jgi:hypothetical protein
LTQSPICRIDADQVLSSSHRDLGYKVQSLLKGGIARKSKVQGQINGLL